MRYIDVTYDGEGRTITLGSGLAGTTVDDVSTTLRLDAATRAMDADIDVVYGVIIRGTATGYPFSRFRDGEAAIPQEVLRACRGGNLPVHLRITSRTDGSIQTSQPVVMRVAAVPDPVEAVRATGDLVMLRQSSWSWRPGIPYTAGAVAEHDGILWIAAEDSTGVEPGSGSEWRALTGVDGSVLRFVRTLREDAQEAIDGIREDARGIREELLHESEDRIRDQGLTAGRVEILESAVAFTETELDTKMPRISEREPETPSDGDLWLLPGERLTPVAYQHASVADVQSATADYTERIAREKAAREAADADAAAETARAIGEAVLEAKAYADRAGASAYRYRGSISNAALDILTDAQTGDMYNISDGGRFPAGSNVVWDGSGWDKLSETVDLSPFAAHVEDRGNPHGTDYTQIGLDARQIAAINSGVTEATPAELRDTRERLDNLISTGREAVPGSILWIKPKETTI